MTYNRRCAKRIHRRERCPVCCGNHHDVQHCSRRFSLPERTAPRLFPQLDSVFRRQYQPPPSERMGRTRQTASKQPKTHSVCGLSRRSVPVSYGLPALGCAGPALEGGHFTRQTGVSRPLRSKPPVKPQGQSFRRWKRSFTGVSAVPLGLLTLYRSVDSCSERGHSRSRSGREHAEPLDVGVGGCKDARMQTFRAEHFVPGKCRPARARYIFT